jgi:ABC-type glutathione transport system ATPase component
MSPLLSVNLSVDYSNNPSVLRNLSLAIAPGEIVGLVGQSGSGKSTLALAILGLLDPRHAIVTGSVWFEGRDLLRLPERELRGIRGRRIGLVLQSASESLNPNLRIGSQLKESWHAHEKGDWTRQMPRVIETLRSLGLDCDESFLRRFPGQVSVGQAQRVLVAMSVMHKPPLLLVDEPTSALDVIAQAELLGLFRKLNTEFNGAMLYISHDLSTVASLCSRVCILDAGEVIESGTPEEIFTRPSQPFTRRLVACGAPRGAAFQGGYAGFHAGIPEGARRIL